MQGMRFDYRDVFRAARLAFSFQKIWIQFVGLIVGYAAYVVLTYLSLALAGQHIDVLWARYGLLPCVGGFPLPWYSWLLFVIGCLVLFISWLAASTGVARAAYMTLKGNHFYTWKEALRFAFKKKAGSAVTTPIIIALIAFFIGLGGVVVGFLGRIPYAGELGISLFSAVWFMASLFLVFVLLALGVSLFLVPAVLATTDDDAFEGIFQSFSVLFTQPWRFILYEVLLTVVAVVGFGVFCFFAKHAWGMMTKILVWGMGDKYANLSYAASYLVQGWVYPAVAWSRMLPANLGYILFFSKDFTALDLPAVTTIASYLFAIVMTFIGGLIVAYPLAIFNAGNGIIFLVLKKIKDDENLLERKDREEEEEQEEDVEEAEPEAKKTTRSKKAKTNSGTSFKK